MNSTKKTVLLKITGEILPHTDQGLDGTLLRTIASQLKELSTDYQFGIVMGAGNFFRGAHPGKDLPISANVSHSVGMLATLMNGLIIQDIFELYDIKTHLFTATQNETIGDRISPQALRKAAQEKDCLIFAGGSGNPYFTTDTTAVLRALQIGACEVWKGTNVEGVYSSDPHKNKDAHLLTQVCYEDAIRNRYAVMDLSAFTLAEQHKMPLRIFNVFKENALLYASKNPSYGSRIS
ncbi:UMP kinase [Candidatus Dependentiae bacterium]|nr:UMP kinase [Candidatus Dependentiae bacterium]